MPTLKSLNKINISVQFGTQIYFTRFNQAINRSINHSIIQLIEQSINQSINQSSNQSSVEQSIDQSINDGNTNVSLDGGKIYHFFEILVRKFRTVDEIYWDFM